MTTEQPQSAKEQLDFLRTEYRHWLEKQNLAQTTIKNRQYYLNYFCQWCSKRGIHFVYQISEKALKEYSLKLMEDFALVTARQNFSEVSRFFEFLVKQGKLVVSPASSIHLPRETVALFKSTLNEEELQAIVDAIDTSTALGIRDRAMFAILYATGCNRTQLVNLLVKDIDFHNKTIMRKGKISTSTIAIKETSFAWIEKYFYQVRSHLAKQGEEYFFLTQLKKPFSVKGFSEHIGKYVRKATGKQGSCEIIRHTKAKLMLKEGNDVSNIQQYLQHTHQDTSIRFQKHTVKETRTDNPLVTNTCQIIKQMSEDQQTYQLFALTRKFLQSLSGKNSKDTINTRRKSLNYFCKWCFQQEILTSQAVTREVMEKYQRFIFDRKTQDEKPIAESTRYGYLSGVVFFFRWLWQKSVILIDPTVHINCKPGQRKLPKTILTEFELEQIINAVDISNNFGIRDRAILETLYSTGIRRGEITRLKIDEVDFHRGIIFIKEGKGGTDRVVPIGQRAIAWLQKYLLEVRPTLAKEDKTTLFLTYMGIPFNPDALSNRVRKYMRNCAKKGSCHIFRHAMASLMLENGADIRHIQEILGHSKISTTQIYTHVSITKLKQIHQTTHPVNFTPQEIPDSEINDKPYKTKQPQEGSKKEQILSGEGEIVPFANDYLQWMKSQQYSAKTILSHFKALRKFIHWTEEHNLKDISSFTKAVMEEYQQYIICCKTKQQIPLCAPYRKILISAVIDFFKWLEAKHLVLQSPAQIMQKPRSQKRLPHQILTLDEIEKIMLQPDITTYLGIRDRTILEILYSTGIRKTELKELSIYDIFWEKGVLFVRFAKGEKQRMVPVGERALNWLQRYVKEVRPILLENSSQHKQYKLFLARHGHALSEGAVHLIVKTSIQKANIHKKGACHLFRHAMATHMLDHGADIRYIQEILGHQSLSTTQVYTHVSINKLKEVHSQTHPATMRNTKTHFFFQE